jgi:hypothetical protein
MIWLALFLQSIAADAQPLPPPIHGGAVPMTCPVGGETFSAWQPAVYSTYGQRPDGKPFSYLPFPFPIPECPTNKLLVFDLFSEVELARLPNLIGSPEYRGMTGIETPYYRAAWLATRLGRFEPEALGLLLFAIWELTPEAKASRPGADSRFERYQAEFVARVERLPSSVAPHQRLALEARAVNALRQMGRFVRPNGCAVLRWWR